MAENVSDNIAKNVLRAKLYISKIKWPWRFKKNKGKKDKYLNKMMA